MRLTSEPIFKFRENLDVVPGTRMSMRGVVCSVRITSNTIL